ncbi:MAG: histidine--tRNA ligase [Candidatus Gracilibacteria bacterium]|nr:histidine--tRNA ligase [Candidatus Gracilibacteria bacterium]
MTTIPLPKQLLIQPHGFPDLGHRESMLQDFVLDVIRRNYGLMGYTSIDTPLVERPEVLFAKAGGQVSKQVYGLRLMHPAPGAEDDSKDLCIRFDLTVPLARYVATNQQSISFPFRRSQIGYVMRGERSKKGRYRSFIQADIDVIGNGELSFYHDAECIATIVNIFKELNLGSFRVHINNRKILNGWFSAYGIKSDDGQRAAMDYVDELDKVGREKVVSNLASIGFTADSANELLVLLTENLPVSQMLEKLLANNESDLLLSAGIDELKQVVETLLAMGVTENHFCIDLSIARGLDYYTSTVYETFMEDHRGIGSVASGGRYDDLASVYTNKDLPGVGVSIGVTRLVLKLIDAGIVDASSSTVAPVLVTTQNMDRNAAHYLRVASILREQGIGVEVYFADRKLGKQMQFASNRGFRIAIIANDDESDRGVVQLRDLRSGEQVEVNISELANRTKVMLG